MKDGHGVPTPPAQTRGSGGYHAIPVTARRNVPAKVPIHRNSKRRASTGVVPVMRTGGSPSLVHAAGAKKVSVVLVLFRKVPVAFGGTLRGVEASRINAVTAPKGKGARRYVVSVYGGISAPNTKGKEANARKAGMAITERHKRPAKRGKEKIRTCRCPVPKTMGKQESSAKQVSIKRYAF